MSFISYAQNFEDVILWRALKHIKEGFYIDIGAAWPENDSVTKSFYEHGWSGINLEPNHLLYEQLAASRSRDCNLCYAIADSIGQQSLYVFEDTGLSTLAPAIADLQQHTGISCEQHMVQVFTLAEVWNKFVPPDQPVHFLKVDVEGLEDIVLKSNDWSKYRPWIVLVEAIVPSSQEENYQAWEDTLLSADYIFAYSDSLNRFYVAKEHAELSSLLKDPPNIFDDFVLSSQFKAETRATQLSTQIETSNEEIARLKQECTDRDERINKDSQEIAALQHECAILDSSLNIILNSKGWKLLSLYYRVTMEVIPHGSARRKTSLFLFNLVKPLLKLSWLGLKACYHFIHSIILKFKKITRIIFSWIISFVYKYSFIKKICLRLLSGAPGLKDKIKKMVQNSSCNKTIAESKIRDNCASPETILFEKNIEKITQIKFEKMLNVDDIDFQQFSGKRIVHISSWDVKCGVANYCKALKSGLDKLVKLNANDVLALDVKMINASRYEQAVKYFYKLIEDCASYDIIMIQHEFSFFTSVFYSIEESISLLNVFLQKLSNTFPQKHILMHVHSPPDLINECNYSYDSGIGKYFYEISQIKNLNVLANVPHIINDLGKYGINSFPGIDPVKTYDNEDRNIIPDLKRSIISKLSIKDNDCIICMVGYINSAKGHLDIIKILNSLPENYKFLVVGGANEEGYYQKLINAVKQNKLESRVHITGRFEDNHLYTYFSLASIMVAPYSNTFKWGSGSITELIRSLKPVIAYDIESLAIINKQCKYKPLILTRSGDSKKLIKKIIKAATNDTLRKSIRQQAEKYLEEMNDVKLAKLYLKTLASSNKKILFINNKEAKCSIWASGKMVYDVLKHSEAFSIDYIEIEPGCKEIPDGYDILLFNYHHITMSWFGKRDIQMLPGIKLTIVLEVLPDDPFCLCPSDYFDGYVVLDPTIKDDFKKVFSFPRPLDLIKPTIKYKKGKVPVIGSFGFATPGKGFEKVIDAVNNEFDRAVVRINIPYGTYVNDSEKTAKLLGAECIARAKSGIEVKITHDYMSKQELVDWCASNTLNCFLYDRDLPGLSATTDQAILSLRPLSVSNNETFRHITQYIPAYPEWSLHKSITDSQPIIKKIKQDWSIDNFNNKFELLLSCVSGKATT